MSRGDAPALYILTKVAIIFFIVSLAGLLVLFTSTLGSSLCSSQANTLSQQIAGDIGSELNSPLEDERLVIGLPTSLDLNGGVDADYAINITRRVIGGGQPDALIVKAYSLADPNCASGVQITYDHSWNEAPAADVYPGTLSGEVPASSMSQRLIFVGTGSPIRDYTYSTGTVREVMVLEPALPYQVPYNPATDYRSYFITLVKCQDKTIDQTGFLFIQDCNSQDATKCLGLNSVGPLGPADLCNYPAETTVS
jgi:hypothetical protein